MGQKDPVIQTFIANCESRLSASMLSWLTHVWLLMSFTILSGGMRDKHALEVLADDVPELRNYKAYYEVLDPKTFEVDTSENPKPLAVGGFGVAYIARSLTTKEKVVLKVARPDVPNVPKDGCKTIRSVTDAIGEAESKKGKCSDEVEKCSDHIMKCLQETQDWMALQWAGDSVQTKLSGLSPEGIHKLLKQTVIGLLAFNIPEVPFVHHDIKWENVAVDDKNCVRVIDLDGAFKATPDSPGSPNYDPNFAAPEARKEPYFTCGKDKDTNKCKLSYSYDMYSAGLMGYDMCDIFTLIFTEQPEHLRLEEFKGETVADRIRTAGRDLLTRNQPRVLEKPGRFLDVFKKADVGKAVAKVKKHDENLAKSFKAKLEYCKGLPDGAMAMLQKMTSQKETDRPSPQEALKSKLFEGLQTGCAWDDPEPETPTDPDEIPNHDSGSPGFDSKGRTGSAMISLLIPILVFQLAF